LQELNMWKIPFRANSGAALVELALTAPLLVLVIVGSAELGRIAYMAIEVESAARAGASYGAENLGNAFGPASAIQQAALNDAPSVPNMNASATTACVCETLNTSTNTPSFNPSTGTTSCTSGIIVGTACDSVSSTSTQSVVDYVVVTTTANVATLLHYPGIPNTFTLTGSSEMRILQN
jgi:Flp pilus assembly protein TadG